MDILQVAIGAAQVEIGFAMMFIDGPAPIVDIAGLAVMARGRQNIRRGYYGSKAPSAGGGSQLHPCVYFDDLSGVEMYA